jgi:hypothetical protein
VPAGQDISLKVEELNRETEASELLSADLLRIEGQSVKRRHKM